MDIPLKNLCLITCKLPLGHEALEVIRFAVDRQPPLTHADLRHGHKRLQEDRSETVV